MKKFRLDILLVGILVIFAVVSTLIISIFNSSEGGVVQILKGDDIVYEYSLDEDIIQEISNGDFTNTLVINGGKAYVSDANCPDLTCVKQGEISKNGESIICLPHKLVVRIVSKDKASLDAISN